MLDRFLKPRWNSPRAQTRIQALQRMPAGDPLIAEMAANDSEPLVRREATSRLGDLGLLVVIARKDLDQSVRESAWDRFVALMELPVLSPEDHQLRVSMLQEIPLATILTRIIRSQAELALKQAAILALQDEMHLEEIALHSSVSILRCTAAERIHSEAILKVLEQESRQRDKQVHRICRDKLDVYEQQRRLKQEHTQKIQSLRTQILQLSQSSFQPMYQARADYLKRCWEELDHEDAEVQEAISRMEERCREHWKQERVLLQWRHLINTMQQSLSARPDHDQLLPWITEILDQREELAKPPEHVNETLHDLCVPLMNRVEELANWWEQWQRLEAQALVITDAELYERRLQALRDAPFDSQALLASLQIPEPAGQSVTEPAKIVNSSEQVSLASTAEKSMIDHQWHDSLTRIEQLIEEGHSEHAMRLWHRLSRHIPNPNPDRERVQHIEQRLHEWQDWHSFAVMPKKQQLLDELKALEASAAEPKTMWQQERMIHRRWRELGVVDHHKELPLWQEFSAVSSRIRERCKPWREEQQRLVEQARQQAEALCLHLQPIDVRALDRQGWKTLRDELNRSQEQWKSIRRYLRESEPVTAAVRAELERLQQAVHREERQNRQRMIELIEQADALTRPEGDGTHKDAATSIRAMQQAWKEIGLHRHRDNQQLWPRFKAACDQVYQLGQQRHEACKQLILQLNPESIDFEASLGFCRSQIAELEHAASLRELLQRKEQSYRQIQARSRDLARSQHMETTWKQLLDANQPDSTSTMKAAILPVAWRKITPPPLQQLSSGQALLLWEYVLDLDAPTDQQDERRNLLLQLWKDGLSGQQLGQQHAYALAGKVLLHPWNPVENERIRRCFDKAWPKEYQP